MRVQEAANEPSSAMAAAPILRATQVYLMAGLCLLVGLGIGYLMRGSQQSVQHVVSAPHALTGTVEAAAPMGRRPTLDQMRLMADKQATPLLEKLKSNPHDTALLLQAAAIYYGTHQFKEATGYYNRALDTEPNNVAIRTKLASSLYFGGDTDGAIAQLNRALTSDPTDANAQFDLGVMKLQGKGDPKGALAAWQRLLKTNPQLSPDRKATVLKLMADVMTMIGDQHGMAGARSDAEHR